ncbi:5-oxoprolinase subunit PxpB [Acetobacter garciniae]|nr:5-oxoprolinase subunit PxpB [Acetobacter garciniae]
MRIHCAGANAFLLDMSEGTFQDTIQVRIWGMAHVLQAAQGITMLTPGANNLLVVFDPQITEIQSIHRLLKQAWDQAASISITPRELVVSVVYGGDGGEDLAHVAQQTRLSETEVVRLHTSCAYRVAMIGYSPGFGYLTGLPPQLHVPRRDRPRLSVERKSVCLGGEFTCVMPQTTPSGWHILGKAQCPPLFDPTAQKPCFLQAGDIVRFVRA